MHADIAIRIYTAVIGRTSPRSNREEKIGTHIFTSIINILHVLSSSPTGDFSLAFFSPILTNLFHVKKFLDLKQEFDFFPYKLLYLVKRWFAYLTSTYLRSTPIKYLSVELLSIIFWTSEGKIYPFYVHFTRNDSITFMLYTTIIIIYFPSNFIHLSHQNHLLCQNS